MSSKVAGCDYGYCQITDPTLVLHEVMHFIVLLPIPLIMKSWFYHTVYQTQIGSLEEIF